MRRRDFITLLGSASATWPFGALAQQTGKLPTVGFLGSDASLWSPWTAAFVQRLRDSAGSRVAPSQPSIAGRRDARSVSPRSWASSCGRRSTSLSRMEAPSQRSSRRPRIFPSCLQSRSIRLALASWRTFRTRAATSLDCRSRRPILPASGSTFA
jgi:hypothetical protein